MLEGNVFKFFLLLKLFPPKVHFFKFDIYSFVQAYDFLKVWAFSLPERYLYLYTYIISVLTAFMICHEILY